jgi:D-methionine transport system ATP-binding protein
MITIQNLHKSFENKEVLAGIDLTIKDGDIFGLVGVSGAGKSTLLRCINGLEPYDSGKLNVNGIEIKDISKNEIRRFRSKIGMVFQQFSLLERKTVFENISFPMECFKYSKQVIEKRVKELLELVDLPDKIKAFPRELSGGQKQRVAIARALTMNPSILLCDEATSALDPNITQSILELLRRINEELKITIVAVTHQMTVMKKLCKNMAVLSLGKVKTVGSVQDIFLKRPDQLVDFLGDDVFKEHPTDCICFEILQYREDKNILSRIAIDTGIKYEVAWGGLNRYQDDIAGSFIINVAPEEAPPLEQYLKQNQIAWRPIKNV